MEYTFENYKSPHLETCWSRALTSEAAQTFPADFFSLYLSGFLKEDHGPKLVKNHWREKKKVSLAPEGFSGHV